MKQAGDASGAGRGRQAVRTCDQSHCDVTWFCLRPSGPQRQSRLSVGRLFRQRLGKPHIRPPWSWPIWVGWAGYGEGGWLGYGLGISLSKNSPSVLAALVCRLQVQNILPRIVGQ